MNGWRRPNQCILLFWTALFVLSSSLAAWSADDSVTLAWPEQSIDQKKLERAARLTLVNRLALQRVQFVWDETIGLSDRVKVSMETALRKSLSIRYDIQNLTLVRKERQGKDVVFHYKFDRPPAEKINISKSALVTFLNMPPHRHEDAHMPVLIEVALTYPDITPSETIENLWRSFLPHHSYDVIFDKIISNFESVKFINQDIPLAELPATTAKGLKLLDLAPTNLSVCEHNVKLTKPELPQLSAFLKSYCKLLPSKITVNSPKKGRMSQEIKRLKNEYAISLQDKPLLYFWITSHSNFDFDKLLPQQNRDVPDGYQENTALQQLFNRLPSDNLDMTILHDFIVGLRRSGFEIIPAELVKLIPEEWQRHLENNLKKGGLQQPSNHRDANRTGGVNQGWEKESQNNSKLGIY
ncbi:hypothetical protein OAS14_05410 [Alphaproteobacteria bacterium]|nr:hypothetical protein [Alphaproteobacteria bacterium]